LNTILDLIKRNKKVKDQVINRKIPFVIVGTKSDLINERQVENEEIQSFCNQLEIPYFECSSKENKNLEQAFNEILKQIILEKYYQKMEKGNCILF
jgi:GTPase SAR1 family protein